jgi:hypothetical protein
MTIYTIYEIRPVNKELVYSYIGSTKNFRNRKHQHKRDCNNFNSTNHNIKLYQFIRDNGGFEMFEMIPLEEYECDTRIQSYIREQYFINQIDNKLNMIKAFISTEERKEYKKNNNIKNGKQYRKRTVEHKREYDIKYREDNQLKLQQKNKEKKLCCCGTIYTGHHLRRHELTKFHLNYLEQLNKKEIITEYIDA